MLSTLTFLFDLSYMFDQSYHICVSVKARADQAATAAATAGDSDSNEVHLRLTTVSYLNTRLATPAAV